MKTIEEKINYYKESLDLFDDGMDKYKFLIDQAKNAKNFPEEYRNDSFKVSGCQAQVWLVPKLNENIEILDKELIKSVKLFDIYEGENIPSGKKSIALNVTIQSSDKTLDENDLEKINKKIITIVETKSGAKIRS